MKEIEKEIRPKYLLKEERENLKTYLTVFTTLAAIISAVLPWEMSRVVAGLFLFAGFGILIQLIRNIFATASRKNKIRIATYGYIVGFIATAALVIGNLYIYIKFGGGWRVNTGTYFIMGLLGVLAFITLVTSIWMYQLKVRSSEVHVETQP